MLNVKVNENTIRRLNKYSLCASATRKKPLLFKNNMEAWLRFAKLHLNKPQDFQNNIRRTDDNKRLLCWPRCAAPSLENSQIQLWSRNTSYQLSSTAVEGWWFGGCFAVTGLERPLEVYQSLPSGQRPTSWSIWTISHVAWQGFLWRSIGTLRTLPRTELLQKVHLINNSGLRELSSLYVSIWHIFCLYKRKSILGYLSNYNQLHMPKHLTSHLRDVTLK